MTGVQTCALPIFQNKQQEVRAQEEHIRQEHMQLERLREVKNRQDQVRGANVDITV